MKNLSDMIKTLEEHSYSYTHYKHQNGEGCINTELLLKQLRLNEQEIKVKVVDEVISEFTNELVSRLTDAIYQRDVGSMTNLINDVAEHTRNKVFNIEEDGVYVNKKSYEKGVDDLAEMICVKATKDSFIISSSVGINVDVVIVDYLLDKVIELSTKLKVGVE